MVLDASRCTNASSGPIWKRSSLRCFGSYCPVDLDHASQSPSDPGSGMPVNFVIWSSQAALVVETLAKFPLVHSPGSASKPSLCRLHRTHAPSAEADVATASEQHSASTMDRQCLLIAPPCPSLRVPASTPHRTRRASLGPASLARKCPPQGASNQYARGLTPLLRVLVQILRHYQREPNTHVAGP